MYGIVLTFGTKVMISSSNLLSIMVSEMLLDSLKI